MMSSSEPKHCPLERASLDVKFLQFVPHLRVGGEGVQILCHLLHCLGYPAALLVQGDQALSGSRILMMQMRSQPEVAAKNRRVTVDGPLRTWVTDCGRGDCRLSVSSVTVNLTSSMCCELVLVRIVDPHQHCFVGTK